MTTVSERGHDTSHDGTHESWRCFVAVQAGQNITGHLRDMVSEVRENTEASGWRVTWTRPQGWHVTLKFLGDVASDRLETVREAVGRAIDGMASFRLAALGLLVLPPGAEPRVLAIGLRDDGSLARLAKRLEVELEPLGFARERRRFTPHLTLGRVRSAPRQPRRKDATKAAGHAHSMATPDWIWRFRDRPLGEDQIQSVEMLRSQLTPGGSIYTPLAAFGLGTGGAGQSSGLEGRT